MRRRRPCRLCGAILQVVFFVANAYVWVGAVLCVFGGFLLGINSRTIILTIQDFNIFDFGMTTPATLLILYGILMLILATTGCFGATSANLLVLFIFIVFVISILIADWTYGIRVYFSTSALMNFTQSMKASLQVAGTANDTGFGIYPIPSIAYWFYLQNRSQSCGMYDYTDWLDNPIATQHWSLLDPCCNEKYEHSECGQLLLMHPESERHSIGDIVNNGLMKKFPKPFRKAFGEISHVGLSLGIALCLCCIIAVSLICLVTCQRYDGFSGPEPRVMPNRTLRKHRNRDRRRRPLIV